MLDSVFPAGLIRALGAQVESHQMWYVADLLFAQLPQPGARRSKCESCDVLFEAPSAREAYEKALRWAQRHEVDNTFHFVGVVSMWALDEKRPDDGTEIGGNFFDVEDVWERVSELIPGEGAALRLQVGGELGYSPGGVDDREAEERFEGDSR